MKVVESSQGPGFAIEGGGDFWIGEGEPPAAPVHVAFAAADRATVDKFHRAAVEAGGRDNGAPGLRPHYHAGYYAAFVIDPDGNNVEAVFHGDRQLPAAWRSLGPAFGNVPAGGKSENSGMSSREGPAG